MMNKEGDKMELEMTFRRSFSELDKIFTVFSGKMTHLPPDFVKFVRNNQDTNYQPDITLENVDTFPYMEETLIMIGFLYSKYLASEEEKKVKKEENRRILEDMKD